MLNFETIHYSWELHKSRLSYDQQQSSMTDMFPTKWRHHISKQSQKPSNKDQPKTHECPAPIFFKLSGPQARQTFLRVRAKMWIIFGENISHVDNLSSLWTISDYFSDVLVPQGWHLGSCLAGPFLSPTLPILVHTYPQNFKVSNNSMCKWYITTAIISTCRYTFTHTHTKKKRIQN